MTDTTPESSPQRRYVSPVREARARQNRRRIIQAAAEQFLAHGYPATSMTQVAAAAGVSPDLVYKTFGSKIGLLKEVLDVVVAGDDDPVAVLDRPGPQRLREETDVHNQLRLLAGGVTEQLERIRPLDDVLRSAAAVDPKAAALRHDIQDRQRHQAMTRIVGWLPPGALRRNLDGEEAADLVWTLTSPEVHDLLRTRRGWSAARYAAWLEAMLASTLLE